MMVVPVIASFAAASSAVAAAGTLAAAMSTVGGFLTIAGAALTTIGAVTKESDLMKIGGFMGLAGGISSALSSANAATGEAAASSAWDAADSAAGSDAAQFNKYKYTPSESIAQTAQPVTGASGLEQVAAEAAAAGGQSLAPVSGGFDYQSVTGGSEVFGNTYNYPDALAQAADAAGGAEAAAGGAEGGSSLWERAGLRNYSPAPQQESVLQKALAERTGEAALRPGWADPASTTQVAVDPLQQGASRLTSNDIGALLDKGMQRVNQFGQWVDKNKEMVKIGGLMLSSMYGPNAEAIDLQKSIMARRYRNMNSPVALRFGNGG